MSNRSWLLCRGWSNCFACTIDGGFVEADDRAASHADQQIHAMSLLKMEQAKASNSTCCSYSSPIVHALSKLPGPREGPVTCNIRPSQFYCKGCVRSNVKNGQPYIVLVGHTVLPIFSAYF